MPTASDPLLLALIDSVTKPAPRTEWVALPRSLGRIYAGQDQLADLRSGDALDALRIGALALLGLAKVEVFPRPTVAVFSFGDTLQHAGDRPEPGRAFDAASPMTQALLAGAGIESLGWPALPQDPARIDAALGDAVDAFDLVLLSATESAGEVLELCLPKLGLPMPQGAAGAPRAWRSSRARLILLDREPEVLQAQFHAWVWPMLAALQYAQAPRQ